MKHLKKEIEDLKFISNKSAEILLELCASNGWQLASAESSRQQSSETWTGRDFSVYSGN
jgi:hypothetical protein